MDPQQHYTQYDLPFYRDHIAPILPPVVLDFHAHTWKSEHWRDVAWETGAAGGKYMVTIEQYGIEALRADGRAIFPDRPYHAVCFGYPTPLADVRKTNDYTAEAGRQPGLFPLMLAGRGLESIEETERRVREQGFFGYKVLLPWLGDDYGSVTPEDMLGEAEMALADSLRLIVLLHVPRSRRLADPAVKEGVRKYAREYPSAQFVLAHCGRCFLPDEMAEAVPAVADLPNVCLDTSMVMDPTALQIVMEHIDSSRLLFATDFPVAAMRGRRVYAADHWIDLVLDGFGCAPSAFRAITPDMRATFMAYEIILALRRAADRAGLQRDQLTAIFHDNGMRLLRNVLNNNPIA